MPFRSSQRRHSVSAPQAFTAEALSSTCMAAESVEMVVVVVVVVVVVSVGTVSEGVRGSRDLLMYCVVKG